MSIVFKISTNTHTHTHAPIFGLELSGQLHIVAFSFFCGGLSVVFVVIVVVSGSSGGDGLLSMIGK